MEATLEKDLEQLIQFSLIEQEYLDKAGTVKRLRVSPFVSQYIQNKMNPQMKIDTINIACLHLKEKLIGFKKAYSQDIGKCKSPAEVTARQAKLADQIKSYDQQVIHLVCQMILLGKQKDQLDDASRVDDDADIIDHSAMKKAKGPGQNGKMQLQAGGKVKDPANALLRAKSKEIVPAVSNQAKFSRSTVAIHNKQKQQHL